MKKLFYYLVLMVAGAGFTISSTAQGNDEESFPEYDIERVVFGDLTLKSTLPSEIKETSGLIFWRESLWTHNDSGGEPVIYRIDTASGEILQKITVKDAVNRDWEDITQDEDFIYIGDFGNNSGNRKDLKIYKLSKLRIPEDGDVQIEAETINFYFSDQKSFDNNNRAHDFDCESVISFNDHLYLFSKNWINGKTRSYRLPKTPGSHEAVFTDSLDVKGLVTAAALNDKGNRLALLGYKDFYPFVVLIRNFEGDAFLDGEMKRLDFPFEGGVQTEGIAFADSTDLLISCEELKTEPSIFSYNTEKWEEMKGNDLPPSVLDNWAITLISKKKKQIKYIAVDVTAMRDGVFYVGIESMMGKPLTFPGYTFDRHMGKSYLEIDVLPFSKNRYRVFLGNGSAKSEKEIFVD
jgi:hypothetical protein